MRKPIGILIEDNFTGNSKLNDQVDGVCFITVNHGSCDGGIFGELSELDIAMMIEGMVRLSDDLIRQYPGVMEIMEKIRREK